LKGRFCIIKSVPRAAGDFINFITLTPSCKHIIRNKDFFGGYMNI